MVFVMELAWDLVLGYSLEIEKAPEKEFELDS